MQNWNLRNDKTCDNCMTIVWQKSKSFLVSVNFEFKKSNFANLKNRILRFLQTKNSYLSGICQVFVTNLSVKKFSEKLKYTIF